MAVQAVEKSNGNKRAIFAGGVTTDVSDGGLAKEFISVGKNIEESIGRTIFIDDRQLNACIALYRKLSKFHNYEGLKQLKMWLDGRPAIGGYNRAQALMSGAELVVGEALGVKLGKDSMKFIEKQVLAKAQRPEDGHEVQ